MQAEGAVEVEDLVWLEGERRPHKGVVGIAIRNDDVETVGSSTLEEDDELLMRIGGGGGLGEDGAREEGGDGGGADERERTALHEAAAGDAAGGEIAAVEVAAPVCGVVDGGADGVHQGVLWWRCGDGAVLH